MLTWRHTNKTRNIRLEKHKRPSTSALSDVKTKKFSLDLRKIRTNREIRGRSAPTGRAEEDPHRRGELPSSEFPNVCEGKSLSQFCIHFSLFLMYKHSDPFSLLGKLCR